MRPAVASVPRSLRAIGVFLLALSSCGPAAPPLPKVDATRFAPAVRRSIEQSAAAAQSAPNDARRVADFAMVLHAHDQFASAIATYRRAHALDRRLPSIAYYLGSALVSEGRYAEAIEPLEQALAAEPASLAVRLNLAGARFSAGHLAAAQADYRALLRDHPALPQAHFGLARTVDGSEALAAYRRSLELFPRYGAAQFALAAAYRRAGDAAAAEKTLVSYERDKTAAPPLDDPAMERVYVLNVSAPGLLRRAQLLDAEGRVAEALALHEQVLAADPKLEQAWVNLISLHARAGRPDRAEEAYRKAVALAPNRSDAHYNFGVLCFSLQRFPEATQAFRKAFDLDPRNAEAAHNLATVLARSGDLNAAAALYRKALALNPDHAAARFHLAQILVTRGQFDAAIAELERIVEPPGPQTPAYLFALGVTQTRAGRPRQARQALERARQQATGLGQSSLVAAIDKQIAALP